MRISTVEITKIAFDIQCQFFAVESSLIDFDFDSKVRFVILFGFSVKISNIIQIAIFF